MMGAHLSHASRRADGLATSAVLDQKYLPHAIETTRRCFDRKTLKGRIKRAQHTANYLFDPKRRPCFQANLVYTS